MASTDPALFEEKVREIRVGDPLLIGRIGNELFLGGHRDFSKEIVLALQGQIVPSD